MSPEEAKHWARQFAEFCKHYPVGPYNVVPYDAIRGISWCILDGDGHHIATVFEEQAAMLIAQRLNG